MRSLQEQLVVPVDDTAGRRATLVYAPSEYVRIVPYAKSYLRMALYVILLVLSFGILLIVSVWFPQIFTRIARIRLPYSCLGDAEYMLVLVHEDGMHSVWIEVPVQRPLKKKSGADKSATANGSLVEVTTPSDDRSKLPWVWFEFKKHRYVFNHEKGEFERYLATVNEDLDKIKARVDCGLDKPQVAAAKSLFGDNSVDIAKPSILMLLFTKTVHPYYMFQVFSSVVWLCQDYVSYAVVILTLSAISLTWEIYSEISNNHRLRKLVKSDHKIQVLRAGAMSDQKMIEIPEAQLVPGDIVQLSTGPVVADVLLLSGSCVVDEASLTGEAIPINKEAARGLRVMITDADARIHFKSSFLHAGSSITRVRDATGPCKAVVLSTGFSTGKGELFRSILFPRTITFEFERDSYRYLAVLTVIAIAAFIKRVMDFVNRGDGYGVFYIIVESLDLVTTAVPPALPLVLSSGIGFAMDRLKKGGIFCIDAKRINSCGQLDTFCFDKTGTLTEESLTLVGLDKINEETLKLERVETFAHAPALLKLAMATCHGLTRADEETELQGYSLELAMFAAAETKIDFIHERTTTNYVATVETADKQQYGILKRFPFDAACQRSSVIVEDVVTKQRYVFVKGSPEAIGQIAIATPAGFKKTTLRYSAEGNYCIGFGMRELSANETINADSREAVESKVAFMGMALFHNELKPESKGMIQELYDAAVDVRMITGDNALTAVHVARLLDMQLKSKVAIVDVNESSEVVYHCVEAITSTDTEQWELLTNANVSRVLNQYDLALTGAALEILRTELSDDSIDQLVRQTTIFARIRPAQKTWIVERLMDFGKVVGMCGDGTNDCGALKAAHVGLALSSAEASIVAPFTSKAKAVTDVPALIREGRSALTTSFLAFKFMVMYPVIQLAMSSTLGHFGTRLSNNQFIWDDGVIVLGLAMTMLYTGSSSKLTKERPPNTLFSLTIVASILSQTLLYIAFFGGMLAIMMQQTWFCARADGMDLLSAFVEKGDASINSTNCAFYTDYLYMVDTEVSDIKVSHEDTTVWQFGHMAYFSVALAFNLKDRFRLPFYTNKWFTGYFLVCLGVTLWFLMDTSDVINKPFHMLSVPGDYRAIMLGLFIAHFILSQIVEMLATWWLPQWRQKSLDKREEEATKQRSQSYLVQPPPQQEEPLVVAQQSSESPISQSSSQNEDAAQTSVKVSSESSAGEISHHTITTTTTTATTATVTSS